MLPELFYVGIKILFVRDDSILLLKRTDPDGRKFLDIPGGRVQDGETFEETLQREVAEELPGISDWRAKKMLHALRLKNVTPDGKPLVLIIFQGELDDVEISLSDEHDGYTWLKITEIEVRSGQEIEGYQLGTQLHEVVKFII
jgi:8-oxo-dGTP pyrophosphatase MutT (NUDIX family)